MIVPIRLQYFLVFWHIYQLFFLFIFLQMPQAFLLDISTSNNIVSSLPQKIQERDGTVILSSFFYLHLGKSDLLPDFSNVLVNLKILCLGDFLWVTFSFIFSECFFAFSVQFLLFCFLFAVFLYKINYLKYYSLLLYDIDLNF